MDAERRNHHSYNVPLTCSVIRFINDPQYLSGEKNYGKGLTSGELWISNAVLQETDVSEHRLTCENITCYRSKLRTMFPSEMNS